MDKRQTIKEWAEADRPREKMLNIGARNLTDAELLAILIASGYEEKSALDIAKEILNHYDNKLSRLCNCTINELVDRFKGIGPARAITIIAALELGKRRRETTDPLVKMDNVQHLYDLLRPKLTDLTHEEFWSVFLNRQLRVIGIRQYSVGGMTGTVVDPRPILRDALTTPGCTHLAIAHNHPSGQTHPSIDDDMVTRKIKNAAATMDLILVDHLIIGNNDYYSYASNGKL